MHKPSEPFELPAALNIYGVLETRDALLAWVSAQVADGHDTLDISAQMVQEVDGAGLQLLAALGNMNHAWHVVDSSDAFTSACQTMGLSQWIDPRHLKPQGVATNGAQP